MPPQDDPHIGTLNEGSLHRGLKRWLAEPGDRFEVPLDEFVIDIVRGDLLIEIQTGAIGAMGRKLDHLLEHHHIRVVHPMPAIRWLEQPGKPRRRSPTKRSIWNLFDELVSIPTLLDHPHLELHIVLVEETELRSGTEMVQRGRRGRVVDRRLDDVVDERLFVSADELLEVIPDELANPFTTAELASAAHIRRDLAQRACYVLRHTGLISEVDRTKAGYLYRR